MVLAHILGEGAEELSRFGCRYPLLEEQDITLFGYSTEAGGVDPVEIRLLEDTRMAKYPMEKVRDGVRDAATGALRDLEQEVDHILVHFDVDVVDVADFAAVDVPHDPGLGLLQVREALSIFLESHKSVGLVVTEFNASRDSDGTLALQLIELIREAKGHGDNIGAARLY
jgi:arginase family enzyme